MSTYNTEKKKKQPYPSPVDLDWENTDSVITHAETRLILPENADADDKLRLLKKSLRDAHAMLTHEFTEAAYVAYVHAYRDLNPIAVLTARRARHSRRWLDQNLPKAASPEEARELRELAARYRSIIDAPGRRQMCEDRTAARLSARAAQARWKSTP